MKSISLKLDEAIFQEAESLLKDLSLSRNRYINEAIAFYNRYQKRRLLEEQLCRESALVADDSLQVLAELEQLEDDEA